MATVLPTIKKMSIKGVGINAKAVLKGLEKDGDKKLIASFAGKAKRVIRGESNFGEWHGFRGEFVGVNRIDGKAFRSSKLFMPQEYTEELIDAIESTDKTTGAVTSVEVEFAVDVNMVADEKSQTGYFYEVISKREVETSNDVNRFAEELGVAGMGKKSEPAKDAGKGKGGK